MRKSQNYDGCSTVEEGKEAAVLPDFLFANLRVGGHPLTGSVRDSKLGIITRYPNRAMPSVAFVETQFDSQD